MGNNSSCLGVKKSSNSIEKNPEVICSGIQIKPLPRPMT